MLQQRVGRVRGGCAFAAHPHHSPACSMRFRSLNMSSTKHISSNCSRRSRRCNLQVQALFTGIVQGTASVTAVTKMQDFEQLLIHFPPSALDGVQLGASVAINGTCLTVTAQPMPDSACFDVIVETLRATNLGTLAPGSIVNFERSARVGDEIGGHNVSGHVHTTATIVRVDETANNRRLTFAVAEAKWMKYILPKGYIALDGTSLTIGEVEGRNFTVYLIPETLRATVFGFKGLGDVVNVEIETQTQAIVDTVERVLAGYMPDAKTAAAAAIATTR